MAEVKHTPWEEVETESSVDLEGCSGWQDIADQSGRTVAIAIGWCGWKDADLDRRARLIAAAPDLFDFARSLDASWSASFPEGPDGECRHGLGAIADEHRALWKQCRAALSKATTQQEGR
nr:hypothetical protein [Brevundimonas naejangsanensis]